MPDIFDAIDDESSLPKYITDYTSKQTYIVEISTDTILALAHAAHIYLAAEPSSKMMERAMRDLVLQTDVAHDVPTSHGVYPSVLTMPKHSKLFPQVVYIPVDYAS